MRDCRDPKLVELLDKALSELDVTVHRDYMYNLLTYDKYANKTVLEALTEEVNAMETFSRGKMKIKCAAIRNHDGEVYEGHNHAEIGHKMIADGVCPKPFPGGENQGFVTECGKYFNRVHSMTIAREADQLPPKTHNKKALYSEDLNYPEKLNPDWKKK